MEAMCHTPRERKSKSLDKECSVEKGKERKEKKEKERKGKMGKGEVIFLVFGSCLQEESRRGKNE